MGIGKLENYSPVPLTIKRGSPLSSRNKIEKISTVHNITDDL